MTTYRIEMITGKSFICKPKMKLDAIELNIGHHKPWWITDTIVINCKHIESIEVINER